MAEDPGTSAALGVAGRLSGFRERAMEWLSARSLRARLVAITLILATAGLAIAGAVTYTSLRSFLLERVDSQLVNSQDRALAYLQGDPRHGDFGRQRQAPPVAIAVLYGPDGAAAGYVLPDEATRVPVLYRRSASGFRTASVDELGTYRLLVSEVEFGLGPPRIEPGGAFQLVTGASLRDVSSTLSRLVWIEILVGLAVLGAMAAGGMWLVRLGLKPLTDIEGAAARIAGGDLSHRIDSAPPTTEVGRLGGALNTMLGTIEEAFDERTESERRLRQFVADASHELQTPLTSVRGYAELFRRGAADRPDDLANAMRRIEAESERMGLLVDDLLLLARLDQGRPMERARVDLAAIARQLGGDAHVVDPDRPITIDAPFAVEVDGDEQRLRQVVANLLSNARVHTPAGTPITVRVLRDGADAVLEVRDRGPGMAAEHAARVFERFFRADASRTRASGGSGLGLSIVAAIVEAHGGTVNVDTAPGDGARFRVVLPAAG